MKPPPLDILAVMNHIVNCPIARKVALVDYLVWVQGILSLPDEHTEQMVAAMEHDKEAMHREDHAKIVALYKAVTSSAQAFREAILAKLKEAGFPKADIPHWIV